MTSGKIQIDWESNISLQLMNPAYSEQAKIAYTQILKQGTDWPGHIWLATSGSTVIKWVALSKQAILSSAQAVNVHLMSNSSDKWTLALPEFHVGGLGILARSYLSGASVEYFKYDHPGKWQASIFYDYLEKTQSTLTSLVPSQLYDLIQLKKRPPRNLRAIIIGGGRLRSEIFKQAIEWGWQILPSYGLTECASQVATANLKENEQKLKILPHVQVSIQDGRLAFKGPSLLSVYAICENGSIKFIDPKKEGWFLSEDSGQLVENELTIFGRVDQMIKIGGENVDFMRLEDVLQTLCLQNHLNHEMTLLAVPEDRLGHVLHLVLAGKREVVAEQIIKEQFNKKVLPFERIRQVHWVDEIPKSALSKILRNDLLNLILKRYSKFSHFEL